MPESLYSLLSPPPAELPKLLELLAGKSGLGGRRAAPRGHKGCPRWKGPSSVLTWERLPPGRPLRHLLQVRHVNFSVSGGSRSAQSLCLSSFFSFSAVCGYRDSMQTFPRWGRNPS